MEGEGKRGNRKGLLNSRGQGRAVESSWPVATVFEEKQKERQNQSASRIECQLSDAHWS